MTTENIIIVGTGAQAKYILEIFRLTNLSVIGLVALPHEDYRTKIYNSDLLGNIDDFEEIFLKFKKPKIILALSNNSLKEELTNKFLPFEPEYISAIHPSATVATTASLGTGSIVNANSVIQPYAKIGSHVMVHSGVIVEHDCVIGDFVNLGPRVTLAGYVTIGKFSTIYTSATVLPSINIGKSVIVGAGSVVLSNIEDCKKVAGTPAIEIQ